MGRSRSRKRQNGPGMFLLRPKALLADAAAFVVVKILVWAGVLPWFAAELTGLIMCGHIMAQVSLGKEGGETTQVKKAGRRSKSRGSRDNNSEVEASDDSSSGDSSSGESEGNARKQDKPIPKRNLKQQPIPPNDSSEESDSEVESDTPPSKPEKRSSIRIPEPEPLSGRNSRTITQGRMANASATQSPLPSALEEESSSSSEESLPPLQHSFKGHNKVNAILPSALPAGSKEDDSTTEDEEDRTGSNTRRPSMSNSVRGVVYDDEVPSQPKRSNGKVEDVPSAWNSTAQQEEETEEDDSEEEERRLSNARKYVEKFGARISYSDMLHEGASNWRDKRTSKSSSGNNGVSSKRSSLGNGDRKSPSRRSPSRKSPPRGRKDTEVSAWTVASEQMQPYSGEEYISTEEEESLTPEVMKRKKERAMSHVEKYGEKIMYSEILKDGVSQWRAKKEAERSKKLVKSEENADTESVASSSSSIDTKSSRKRRKKDKSRDNLKSASVPIEDSGIESTGENQDSEAEKKKKKKKKKEKKEKKEKKKKKEKKTETLAESESESLEKSSRRSNSSKRKKHMERGDSVVSVRSKQANFESLMKRKLASSEEDSDEDPDARFARRKSGLRKAKYMGQPTHSKAVRDEFTSFIHQSKGRK